MPHSFSATRTTRPPQPDDLLAWYDAHARSLPWRSTPGQTADPYRVWLSEIMLQQTTVTAVVPYFENFTKSWPLIEDLARAPDEQVLKAWAGLGYYARARNLIACARKVSSEFNGVFPRNEKDLLALPGIGPYTAAAIAAIAFGQPATVVDGNVERVMARIFAVTEPLPGAKHQLRQHASGLTPRSRPGDYAQAVMDLGATICRPKSPRCDVCPWLGSCRAKALGLAADLPKRDKKPPRPLRHGVAFWVMTERGEVLLRRRPEKGLLGAMTEVLSTDWRAAPWSRKDALEQAPIEADWQTTGAVISHVFTHFHLKLEVLVARPSGRLDLHEHADQDRCRWVPVDGLGEEALPSVMRKIVRAVTA